MSPAKKTVDINITAMAPKNSVRGVVSPSSSTSSAELNLDYEVHWKDPQTTRAHVVSPEAQEPVYPSPNLKHRTVTPEKEYIAQYPTHVKHAQEDLVKVVTPDRASAPRAPVAPEIAEKSKSVAFADPNSVHTRFIASPTTIFRQQEGGSGVRPADSTVEFIPVSVSPPLSETAKRVKPQPTPPRTEKPPFGYFKPASTPYERRYAPTMRYAPRRADVAADLRPPFSVMTPPLRAAGPLAYEIAHHMRYIPPKPCYRTTYQDDYKWHKGFYGEPLKSDGSTQTAKEAPAVSSKAVLPDTLSKIYPSKQAKREAKKERRKSRLRDTHISEQQKRSESLQPAKPPQRIIPLMYQTENMRAYGCPMR